MAFRRLLSPMGSAVSLGISVIVGHICRDTALPCPASIPRSRSHSVRPKNLKLVRRFYLSSIFNHRM
ncbi:hypothetical protein, partial [Microcoleus anatoxicus]